MFFKTFLVSFLLYYHDFISVLPEAKLQSLAILDAEISAIWNSKLPDHIDQAARAWASETKLKNRRNFLVGSAMAFGAFLTVAGDNIDDNYISLGTV